MSLTRKAEVGDPRRRKRCTICKQYGHTAFYCFKKERKPIKRSTKPIRWRSKKAETKYGELHKRWHKLNPPDENKQWECWLQLSEFCPKMLTYEQLQLEHVYPKSKFPQLQYNPDNIKPACGFCNKMKLSNTPEQLALYFVNIAILVQSPEWKAWRRKIEPFLNKYALYDS